MKKLTDAGVTDTTRVFVVAELGSADTTISRNIIYIAPTKEVHLKPASLKTEISKFDPVPWEKPKVGNSYKVKISSPVLARSVYLSFGSLDVQISDNYFDILPGETAEVSVNSKASLDAIKAQLKVISLTDAFNNVGQPATIGASK